jgi:signal transduction histidine kinase
VAKDDPTGGSSTAGTAALSLQPDDPDLDALALVREAFAEDVDEIITAGEPRTRRLADSSSSLRTVLFAADALTAVALDCGWRACNIDRVIAHTAKACGVSTAEARSQIFLHAAHNPRLLELPPRMAMEFQLRLLQAITPVDEVSLWTGSQSTSLECVLSFGGNGATRRVRTVARLALSADSDDDLQQGLVLGVRVLRWQRSFAALVLRRRAGRDGEDALSFARETAAALTPLLERDMLLERSTRRERSLVEASEKRLARLGYDLHDGPLQDLAALTADIRLARTQIHRHIQPTEVRLIDGRLQDLEARAAEIDKSLRELATSLEPKHVLELPLVTVFQREIEAFERRTGVETLLDMSGDFGELSASQRLALFRAVQEALTNVREHSDATVVQVSLEARRSCTELRVIDNGSGFDVTRVLIDAARRGRLGLVGVSERVRLLGGTFDIVSRRDKYTELFVSLPVWRPTAVPAAVEQADAV